MQPDNSYWFVRNELAHMIFTLTGKHFGLDSFLVGETQTAFFERFPEVTIDRYCDVLRNAQDRVNLWLLDYLIEKGF